MGVKRVARTHILQGLLLRDSGKPAWEPLDAPSSSMTHLDFPSVPREKEDVPLGSKDGILTWG